MKAVVVKKTSSSKQVKQRTNGSSAHHLIRRIEAGAKFAELESLRRQLGLSLEQLSDKLGISRATLHRRKASGRLGPDESDRVYRLQRLLKQATAVFGDNQRACEWLSFPQYGLGGAVPLDYARTEVGGREVENLLGAIEYGVYY